MNTFKHNTFDERKLEYAERIYDRMCKDFDDNIIVPLAAEAQEKINWMMEKAKIFIDDELSLENKKKAANEICDYLVYIKNNHKVYDLDCYEIFKDTFCRMWINDYDILLKIAIDRLEV